MVISETPRSSLSSDTRTARRSSKELDDARAALGRDHLVDFRCSL